MLCTNDCNSTNQPYIKMNGKECTDDCNKENMHIQNNNKFCGTCSDIDFLNLTSNLCVKCQEKITNCIKCSIEDDIIKCDLCQNSLLVQADQLSCANDCSEGTYKRRNVNKCTSNCSESDGDKNPSQSSSNKVCQEKCESNEYETQDHTCNLCADIAGDCIQCKGESQETAICLVCDENSENKYLKNNTYCVSACEIDDGQAFGYKINECVKSCYQRNNLWIRRENNCDVEECSDDEFFYLNITGQYTEKLCVKCYDTDKGGMENCIKCNSKTICTECQTGFYVGVNANKCVSSCAPQYLNTIGTKCVSNCFLNDNGSY
eukprot:TRINITY_DN3043_c0_g3_i3.p2 TRINITY_DN3043_c0_g3~~TRINITY_DN3043_c0_g3_i3.p2  ORF type:complete len:319 (-),score=73.68 TRINITY_DN3043_c0_g3_i3:794-1750(-)